MEIKPLVSGTLIFKVYIFCFLCVPDSYFFSVFQFTQLFSYNKIVAHI